MHILTRVLLTAILALALAGCDRFLQQIPADESSPGQSQAAPSQTAPGDAPFPPTREASPSQPPVQPDVPSFEPTPEIPPPVY
ncbi:MAG TPA: hypothetical protein VFH63_05735 [candidate division Zixibacteria bacterium]|nr:hypothetical protein [candidate division Zixibacteria bacterium]